MDKKIKFIWKFYGLEAKGTAEHHVIHLIEYCQNKQFQGESSVEPIEEGGFQAYLILEESNAIIAHPTLKPHAAFVTS